MESICTWAEHNHYGVSQQIEDKNEQPMWRVARPHTGSKYLRLRSCFDKYITASEHHFKGITLLSFSGKRVTQMWPQNVESINTFDWEPVVKGGKLKLKSYYGTYLLANVSAPPWNIFVSYNIPQNQRYQDWLVWEVQKVRVPNIVPLKILELHLLFTLSFQSFTGKFQTIEDFG